MSLPVYLDNNATTPLDERVLSAMLPFLREHFANPSSLHQPAQYARHAIEEARAELASLIGSRPREVSFTSGGTESNHLAIRGILAARADKRHVITTAVEHECILRLCGQLEREGLAVTYLGVDGFGRLDLDELRAAIRPDTALISVMHANNETGVVFPVEAVGAIAREHGVPLHVDAAQTIGKVSVKLQSLPVDLMTIAAHKFHGPKGVGALYVRKGVKLRPLLLGGHQEHDLRAGTENVAGIVGVGVAAQLAGTHMAEEMTRVRAMRDRLEAGILERVAYARPIGDRQARLPNTASIGFASLEAEAILIVFSNNGICVSSGSACSSGSLEASHVLTAMGVDPSLTHGAIRFSLSRLNREDEIDHVIDQTPRLLERLRPLSVNTSPIPRTGQNA